MCVRFKVQYLLWLDEWVDVAFFGDRKSAVAFKDATQRASPHYSIRVVWYKRPESKAPDWPPWLKKASRSQ
ncbi:hypothetical protein ABIA40_000272 [Bradyrhizobium sp. USDA 223]